MLPAAGSACAQSTAKGQAFPSRPIRAVVASPASSSPDLIARAVTREAENILGQNFIIDNRAGANGIIAAGIVGNAAPDGYTLLHIAPAFLLNSLVQKNLPYDVRRDFVPVTCVAAGVGYLMLVNPSLPVKSVKEFIALAKTPPVIVNRLQAAVSAALKAPKIIDFLDAAAFYPVGSTPEEFRVFVDTELKRYARNLREAKVAQQ